MRKMYTVCDITIYEDLSKTLTYLEHGTPIERQNALSSIALEFSHRKALFDTVWEVFISDEHRDVQLKAFQTAIHLANSKQLEHIITFALEDGNVVPPSIRKRLPRHILIHLKQQNKITY